MAPSTAEMNGETSVSLALQTVLASLDDSKAEKIVPIDLRGKSVIGDHMVIASGRSHRHVTAVADQLLRALKESGHSNNAKVEGLASGDWVLIDTGDIIIHIFRPEVREFYNLEKMWLAPELDGETVH
ncbi:ribosome silencing factor [Phyllobacterium sp. TAF24]|uniref:ribosome silencing factor n=1 Tax=unclassified Phyllobacterium TaxID=2638441 RepID=UPI0008853851|nr:ribosome silencing factor [Phyllobacterium sp. OV277]SDO72320.1 ribosome-associated protein [Phyllobacterium sp. OV277]